MERYVFFCQILALASVVNALCRHRQCYVKTKKLLLVLPNFLASASLMLVVGEGSIIICLFAPIGLIFNAIDMKPFLSQFYS